MNNYIDQLKLNLLANVGDKLNDHYMSDIEIANCFTCAPITQIASKLNITENDIQPYGKYKAKITAKDNAKRGKLILVTAINPTSAGEGKTTTSIGLADALAIANKRVCLALREPSLGPVFGVKGGATGGGLSQVIPMQDINLHFTGDLHAITTANNLLSSIIDNHLQQGNLLNINPLKILHKRCMDLNDRSLRFVTIGQGTSKDGVTRQESFNITAASEVMAILCLSRDLADLKLRLGNITVAYDNDDKPIYARQLKAQDAMAILLKDALSPNLVQTLIGTPAIIHGGPFANIAHGCNSVIATKTALSLADFVVTEAGFGADLGAQKFVDVKCKTNNLTPNVVVIVATIRALKLHGGIDKTLLKTPNAPAVKLGVANLNKHIENISNHYKLPTVVAINTFSTDTQEEIDVVIENCKQYNVQAIPVNVWGRGGLGATELANKVVELAASLPTINFTYDDNQSIVDKVNAVATKIYGAQDVDFTPQALEDIKTINNAGFAALPIIIAKTQYSLSDDAKLLNAPTNFTLHIKRVELRSGSGFIVCVAGEIMLMPGLPKVPASDNMTIDNDGNVCGLF